MVQPIFTAEGLATFAAAYPHTPAKLTHNLTSHALLELGALVDLAAALPGESIEYNPGRLPIGIAPENIPEPMLSPVETIRAIETAGAWMVLKRIEQHPSYAALLERVLAGLEPLVAPGTGAMLRREGFIFVTSPGSVTPFHFDPEHNVLLQVRGRKTMTLFPDADEAMFAPEVHERFHQGEHHRNLPWRDEFASRGSQITIEPGEAIHVPVKVPHWVQNGAEVSISLSVTWRSEWSFAEADARALNSVLRRAGLSPRAPDPWPAANRAKSLAWRALRKVGGHRAAG